MRRSMSAVAWHPCGAGGYRGADVQQGRSVLAVCQANEANMPYRIGEGPRMWTEPTPVQRRALEQRETGIIMRALVLPIPAATLLPLVVPSRKVLVSVYNNTIG